MPENLTELRADFDPRDSRAQAMVRELARRVNQGINSCATASDTALLASVILSHPRSNEGAVHGMRADLCLQKIQTLRQILERCGELVGWSISAGESKTEEASGEIEIITSGLNQRSVSDEAKKRPSDLVASALKWGFLQSLRDESGQTYIKPAESAQLNLWWYRGTIFHLLAIPGIVATILERGLIREGHTQPQTSGLTLQAIEVQLASLRLLWEDELFWPESTSTAAIANAALETFASMGLVLLDRQTQTVTLNADPESIATLSWIAGLVKPEIEIYGVQLGAAIQLVQDAGLFARDELISHAVKLHRSAFLRGQMLVQSQLSSVFGSRTFDAFTRAGVFVTSEGAALTLVYAQLTMISEFLDCDRWRDYSF